VSLDRVVKASKLTPAQAVAVASAVLAELAALHGTGSSHGSIEPRKVVIYGDGHVALGPGMLAEAGKFSNSEFRLDVRAAGSVICVAFGVDAVPHEHASLSRAEREAPAAVVTARAMAQGAMGSDVNRARVAFRDTAGELASPEQLAASIRELAAIAGKIGARPVTMAPTAPIEPAPPLEPATQAPTPADPAVPVEPVARPPAPVIVPTAPIQPAPVSVPTAPIKPAPAATAPYRPPWFTEPGAPIQQPAPTRAPGAAMDLDDHARPPIWRKPIVIAAAVLVVLAVPAGFILTGNRNPSRGQGPTANSPAAAASPSTTAKPSPAATPSAKPPTPSPSLPPTTSAKVTAAELKPNGQCATGTTCSIEVTVKFPNSNPAQNYAWTFKLIDKCTGKVTDAPGGSVTSQAGWIYVQADNQVALPATNNPLLVYVVTSAPDVISSQPMTVGSGGC
jgi:hypothetical protein